MWVCTILVRLQFPLNKAWHQSSRVSVVVFWLVLLWTPQLYSRPTVQVLVSLVLTNKVILQLCVAFNGYVCHKNVSQKTAVFCLFCFVFVWFAFICWAANLALFPSIVWSLAVPKKTEWKGLVQIIMWMTSVSTSVFWWWVWLNLISRPSHYSVFDHSYHAKTEREGPVHFIMWMTSCLL